MKPEADITILPTIDSTNIYAMQQVHAHMAKDGQVYFALEQTAGRGQRGKQWLSAPGTNIMMSMVFDVDGLPHERQFTFNMAMALACYDYYKSVAGDEVSVKWPNDIYWRDRKAGGILVENLIQSGMWTWSIVGIGLNINQTRFDPSISRKPVSLKQITGRDIDLMEALNALAVQLRYRWDELRRSPLGILEAYEAVLYKKGEKVKFKKDNRVFEAIVQGVDAYGRLRVESNIEELFAHGEIEWL